MRCEDLTWDDIDWGDLSTEYIELFYNENIVSHCYEQHFRVQPGDIVLDIGANVGTFALSVLERKPHKIICVEPSDKFINSLRKNVAGYPVSLVYKAIGNKDEFNLPYSKRSTYVELVDREASVFHLTTLKTLVNDYSLHYIDFLKFDCEGGEFSIFTEENRDFILSSVKHISGEWHIAYMDNAIENFLYFRDRFLYAAKEFYVYERNGKNITENIKDDQSTINFFNWWNNNPYLYGQYIIHARFN